MVKGLIQAFVGLLYLLQILSTNGLFETLYPEIQYNKEDLTAVKFIGARSHDGRSKRNSADCHAEILTFNITIDGEHVTLDLTENPDIDINRPIYVEENGKIVPRAIPSLVDIKCFQDRSKHAAICVTYNHRVEGGCSYTLEGTFACEAGSCVIHPSRKTNLAFDHVARVVSTSPDLYCDFILPDVGKTVRMDEDVRHRQSPKFHHKKPTEYKLKLFVVADSLIYDFWMSRVTGVTTATKVSLTYDKIRAYTASLLNGIHLRYGNIGDPYADYRVVFSGLLIQANAYSSPFTTGISTANLDDPERPNVDANKSLIMFREWVEQHLSSISGKDHVMLLSKAEFHKDKSKAISGLSYMSRLCTNYSISITEDLPDFKTIGIASHGLAHRIDKHFFLFGGLQSYLRLVEKKCIWEQFEKSLGANHDGTKNSCNPGDNFIMSTARDSTQSSPVKNSWLFSSCSLEDFQIYLAELDASGTNCLLEEMGKPDAADTQPNLPAGQFYSIEEQCSIAFGDNSYFCRGFYNGSYEEVCKGAYCSIPDTTFCRQITPARGTSCGATLWCIGDQCTSDENAPGLPHVTDDCALGDQPGEIAFGLTCEDVARTNSNRCYQEYFRLRCCDTCRSLERSNPDCLYGDRTNDCKAKACRSYNKDTRTRLCCATCKSPRVKRIVSNSCSVSMFLPWIQNISDSGQCDISAEDCTTPTVNLISISNLDDTKTPKCRFTELKVDSQGPLLVSGAQVQDGLLDSCTSLTCSVPNNTIPATDGIYVVGWLVSVSSDGINFGNERVYLAVDSECMACETSPFVTCTLQASFCFIDGQCYSDQYRNPANKCQQCIAAQPGAWSQTENVCNVAGKCYDDGETDVDIPCLQCALASSSNTLQIIADKCLIGGVCFSEGEVNPDDKCQKCNSTTDQSSFSVRNDVCNVGGKCYDDGEVDVNNTCLRCEYSSSTDTLHIIGGNCFIENQCYSEGDNNSVSDCEICVSLTSQTAFSVPADKCLIGGVCLSEGDVNPDDKCQKCNSATNQSAFSVRNDVCNVGGKCYDDGEVDVNNTCLRCEVSDTLQIIGGNCFIENQCYSEGDNNSVSDCEICVSLTSQTAFSVPADKCLIGGVCLSEGDVNPDDKCQKCNSATNQSAFSVRNDVCNVGGKCYDDGEVDVNNTCLRCEVSDTLQIIGGNCFIENQCYSEGDNNSVSDCEICVSLTSQTAFSVPADKCLIGGVCFSEGDVNPDDKCQKCDPTTHQTAFSVRNDVCNVGGKCYDDGEVDVNNTCLRCEVSDTLQIIDGFCFIENVCFADGESNNLNPCESCIPSTSQTTFSDSDNVCVIDGVCYSDGQVNPQNDCEACDPNQDQSGFSVRTNVCVIGSDCYANGAHPDGLPCQYCDLLVSNSSLQTAGETCFVGGFCYDGGQQNPDNSCQECDPDFPTVFTDRTSVCEINGKCYAGQEQNPANNCEKCDLSSPSSWTAITIPLRSGGDASCSAVCAHLVNNVPNYITFACKPTITSDSMIDAVCYVQDVNSLPGIGCEGIQAFFTRLSAFCSHATLADAQADPVACL